MQTAPVAAAECILESLTPTIEEDNMQKLIETIHHAGGRCYLIGGAVIDKLRNQEPKDWDIEVHGIPIIELRQLLQQHNYTCHEVGLAFGVIKLKIGNEDIDLSIPRRENSIGTGHKDFDVELDHTMTCKEAGRRRDLTINSMYMDMLNGHISDPFGGQYDLQVGVLRATDPDTFIEDPLRPLRIMQLLPRKGKYVDYETIKLCKMITDDFQYLPKERVFEEFVKLLLLSDTPSMGLEFLRQCEWITHFPELANLAGCEQHPDHHPEGDVWTHTMRVLDYAALYCREWVPDDWKLPFMFASLLHDVGKPATTDVKNGWTAYGHDAIGMPLARNFMSRITNDIKLIDRVCRLVKCHMRPGQLTRAEAKSNGWKRLHNVIRLDVLGYLSQADSISRLNHPDVHLPSEECFKYFVKFGKTKIPPILMGRHLIDRGLEPGPEFSIILYAAYEIQIDCNITDVQTLFEEACKYD